jgi:hypothetical protein
MSNEQTGKLWHVYVTRDIALVPNVAQTEVGYFLDVDPVRVTRFDDVESMGSAILQAITAGSPKVPTPTRAAFPGPVVLKPAEARTWKAFERRAAVFTILQGSDRTEIAESGRNRSGEWENSPSQSQKLAANSTAFDIATRIADCVRNRDDISGQVKTNHSDTRPTRPRRRKE